MVLRPIGEDEHFVTLQATLPAFDTVMLAPQSEGDGEGDRGADRGPEPRAGVARRVAYEFVLRMGETNLRYGPLGLRPEGTASDRRFLVFPGFTTPRWMQGAVLYHIFVDRFYNGDPHNDVLTNEYIYDGHPSQQVKNWLQYPDAERTYKDGANLTREFYGGDLQGVIAKLDYLAEEHGEGVSVMRTLKQALDPHNLMNPGKGLRLVD